MIDEKEKFELEFNRFLTSLKSYVSDTASNWSIKGFIDIHKNIYSILFNSEMLNVFVSSIFALATLE